MSKDLIIKELNDLSFRLSQSGIEMTRKEASEEVARIANEIKDVNSFPNDFDLAVIRFIDRYYDNLAKMTRLEIDIRLMPMNGYNRDSIFADINAIQDDLRKAIKELADSYDSN